jgi:hypothetical protein
MPARRQLQRVNGSRGARWIATKITTAAAAMMARRPPAIAHV